MALGRPCSAPFYSGRASATLCLPPRRGPATSPRFTSSRTTWARPHVESSRPEASANAPPSTARPRQIELGAASRLCQPPASTSLDQPRSTGRYIHWRAGHTGIVFHIGACAPPARFPRQQHRAGYGRPITEPVDCVCAAPPRAEHPPKGRGYPRAGRGCPPPQAGDVPAAGEISPGAVRGRHRVTGSPIDRHRSPGLARARL